MNRPRLHRIVSAVEGEAMDLNEAQQVDMAQFRQILAELQRDALRYRWRKENPAIEVEVFRGRYRCTARDSVVTEWLDSYDEAIDAAMQGANV